MIGAQSHRIDNVRGDPHCIRLSAEDAPLGPHRNIRRAVIERPARPRRDGGFGARGQTDAALSTSSSRPAPHCLTAGRDESRIGLVPDRRVIEGSPPDDAGADRSIRLGAFQESALDRTRGCTRIAPVSIRRTAQPGRSEERGELAGQTETPRIRSIRGVWPRGATRRSEPQTEPSRRRRATTPLTMPGSRLRSTAALRESGLWWPPAYCMRRRRHRARSRGPMPAGFA
jgi:hypothetical protein